MRPAKLIALIVLPLAVCFASCKSPQKAAPAPQPKPSVSNAVGDVSASVGALNTANAEKAGKLAAVLDSITIANEGNPDGAPKDTVREETEVAKSINGNVEPDPVAAAIATERRIAKAEGNLEESQRLYAEAKADANQANAKLVEAQTRANASLELARSELTKMQAEFDKAQRLIEAERAAHAAEVKRLKDEAERKVQMQQVRMFNIGGAAAFVVAVGSVAIGGIGGLRTIGGLALLISGMCFGMAQIVSYWWFKWACLGSVLIALGYAWYVMQKAERAKAAEGALKAVVPVLDDLYDNEPTDDGKKILDTKIFDRLKDIMTAQERKAVHNLRGDEIEKPT